MKDAQKPDHVSLTTLVGRLREGRFVIPDFQREFEWKPGDIRELVRSIFLDYYIGSLLLWKSKPESFTALSCEPIYGYGGDGNPEHIVLDGQQRLTAMHYVFLAPDEPLPNRSNRFLYFIHVDRFMEESPQGVSAGVEVAVERAGRTLTELRPRLNLFGQNPQLIPTPAVLYRPQHDLYLSIAGRLDPEADFVMIRAVQSPLITWIWVGGLIVILGTSYALSPGGRRLRERQRQGAVRA